MLLRRVLLVITLVLLLLASTAVGWYAATWQRPFAGLNEITPP